MDSCFYTVIIIHIIGFVYYLKFKTNKIFRPQLSLYKVQIYKLKKMLITKIPIIILNIEAINNNDLDYALTMIISEKCNSKEVIDQYNSANLKG